MANTETNKKDIAEEEKLKTTKQWLMALLFKKKKLLLLSVNFVLHTYKLRERVL